MRMLGLGMLLWIGGSLSLWGFAPKDEATFKKNCIRLLNSQQYTFLTQYFSHHYPRFKNSKKRIDNYYIRDIIFKIPFIDSKKKIIDSYIKNTHQPSRKVFYLKGQISFFEENWSVAKKAFLEAVDKKKYYYLGMVEKNQGNLIDAEKWFLRGVKSLKDQPYFLNEIKLMLADIYYKWNLFKKSYKLLLEVRGDQPLKYVLLYSILLTEGKKVKAEKVYQVVKEKQNNPQYERLLNRYLRILKER